ncbi:hypothetical protein GCM10009540_00030 [Streptomyces turgidiscabies]
MAVTVEVCVVRSSIGTACPLLAASVCATSIGPPVDGPAGSRAAARTVGIATSRLTAVANRVRRQVKPPRLSRTDGLGITEHSYGRGHGRANTAIDPCLLEVSGDPHVPGYPDCQRR